MATPEHAWHQRSGRWLRTTLTTRRLVRRDDHGAVWRYVVISRRTGEVIAESTAQTVWLAMEAADKIGVTLDPPGAVGIPGDPR